MQRLRDAGGFAAGPPVHETPASMWQRMFDLNATSVVNTVKAVVPGMIERKAGNIINVAAAASARGQPNMAAYGVAKNAVVRLTESMAAELRPHGIRVICICPSEVQTNWMGKSGRNNPNKLYADDIAATIMAGRKPWTKLVREA